ncbi:AraC family transcriptional regulator [Pectobacterium parmentieri]|uniref:DNA-binding response regulator n=1 Tax=Pectobacterium parmentieri TaxID=1905730 RepID=A0A8B3FH63_PECPM|nr:AraC family transcriptional regulator [Pectobacterium parmentieri]AOR61346.1 DNA-binding response regulator [Pectobacterium parmentieri]AYH07526.1 DNA-binding response regulator [Pectobacterium parmentieri]AYH11993.1 DNA-binding response regulator [Pectobacterium parmentieri]AYH16278.1 DNA-binding response regulator [Pectobacterium parmentieri]AYH17293.1 DNA-binding response regulator [Pectobacterium parmentieri]
MYNIVIVEDEYIESESLKRIISHCVENSVIHEAPTGRQAIQLIDQLSQIDMMFVDINIPLPNGNQVIEYLKKKNTATKVIVTTANDDFDIVRHMLSLKVDDYLLKPVKQSILNDTIRKTLLVDEEAAAATREQRQNISDLMSRCDYPAWHTFLFSILDAACTGQVFGDDRSKTMTDLLELVQQHLAGMGDKYAVCRNNVATVIQDIHQQGLPASHYWRVMNGLLSMSEGIFEQVFKNTCGNMDFVDRAKFHIEKNILSNLTLDDIAAKSFVSPCYLSRAFKKSMGTGFSSYITSRKISMAKSLLQFSDLKVNTIALELSWQDANYFCRIFKKEAGISPSDYRRIVSPEAC